MRLTKVMALLFSLTGHASSYITSAPSLPRTKQLAWLNRMTDKFCSTAPGQLSHEMMDSAHELIYAWAHLESKECALKAESLIKRVVEERHAGNLKATMSLGDYNLLLEGWARSKAGSAAAERCEQILLEMQEHSDIVPDLDSFKMVLMAWRVSDSPDAAIRAQRVLEYMIHLYTSGLNTLSCPDSDCFDITLQLWARSGRSDAPKRAELLVIAMERLHHATQQKKLQPKTTSFNAVLAAWSKSKDPDAVKHCLEVLRFMETHAKLGDTAIEPDMVTYSTCISSLARFNGPAEKAESLLRRIEAAAVERDSKLVPDTILYNSVISCWARTTESGAYRKARSVLDRQINQHLEVDNSKCKPDVYGFTSVLASCAMEPKEKYKAFQVALATFQQLRHSNEYGAPNHVTYGTMMKCCARLISHTNPLRRKWVKFVMTNAIEDGCVGDMVMGRFREAATPDLFREIMEGIDKKNLPEAWTANVDEKRDCRKRKCNAKHRRRAEV
ncbi:hypothetical protein MHU86_15466 [Fragilaria crotonensis]|nr:hypothetical protein MHU86_15466 [Fragilaria crotonensis]